LDILSCIVSNRIYILFKFHILSKLWSLNRARVGADMDMHGFD